MYVIECCSDGVEVWCDWLECFVDLVDFFWFGVEVFRRDVRVVDVVFFVVGDVDFYFEEVVDFFYVC